MLHHFTGEYIALDTQLNFIEAMVSSLSGCAIVQRNIVS